MLILDMFRKEQLQDCSACAGFFSSSLGSCLKDFSTTSIKEWSWILSSNSGRLPMFDSFHTSHQVLVLHLNVIFLCCSRAMLRRINIKNKCFQGANSGLILTGNVQPFWIWSKRPRKKHPAAWSCGEVLWMASDRCLHRVLSLPSWLSCTLRSSGVIKTQWQEFGLLTS